jgi:integrase
MHALKPPAKQNQRSRLLTPDELKQVWNASKQLDEFGCIVRLCLLSGQRRGQWAKVDQSWLQDGILTFPAAVMKGAKDHSIPASPLVQELVKQLQHSCVSWSKPKKRLDHISATSGYTLHDLRRTTASLLAQLKVEPHIIQKILSHSSGPISGVSSIYNRYQYVPEMRAAFAKLEEHLESIVGTL